MAEPQNGTSPPAVKDTDIVNVNTNVNVKKEEKPFSWLYATPPLLQTDTLLISFVVTLIPYLSSSSSALKNVPLEYRRTFSARDPNSMRNTSLR